MSFGARAAGPDEFSGAIVPAEDDKGYVLEYAIPWKLLNAADDPPRVWVWERAANWGRAEYR